MSYTPREIGRRDLGRITAGTPMRTGNPEAQDLSHNDRFQGYKGSKGLLSSPINPGKGTS